MLVMQACNNTEEQKKTVDKPVQLTGSWYKHFTGTIAGKAVDVNLCFNEGKTTGTYYYGNNGIAISISTGEDTTETDNNLYITEIAPTDSNGNNDYAQNPHWMVTLTGDKLVGKWISSDGKQTYLIDLKEDYPAGTYPFDIIVADSGASWGIASATASYMVCVPAASANKADKDFLDSVLKAGLDCKSNDYRSCLIQHNINYLLASQMG